MVQNYCVVKILVFVALSICSINGFNLSPFPNLIFKEPKIKTQTQSSYFGFTINLRESSVIVGAPRAQSTLSLQLKINEPGAVYKCQIANGACATLIFDYTGNLAVERDNISFSQEIKDYQWLGASMDGGSRDTDKIVVCAPRLMANSAKEYLMHGICYWKSDTLTDDPLRVVEIAPLKMRSNQIREHNSETAFYHMFGEQGLSVHITSNNEEIIVGAPGIFNWKGSVVRYRAKTDDEKTEKDRQYFLRNKKIKYQSDVPNPLLWKQTSDSYFGFSVGSGFFDSAMPKKILYVASAPKANGQSGEVYIFDIIKNAKEEYSIEKFKVFQGSQFGEYFGYAVLAEDLNGDELTDLIVTAPHYSSHRHFERGAIYVFINKGNFFFNLQEVILSPVQESGRFGTTISKLGDINRDGFNDIAVGAPFAGNGSVFIYLGSSKGLRKISSQRINAGPIDTPWSSSSSPMFGHGLSKGSDIDNNGFNDLAIGAPNAESVFVYNAYPVVKIHASINSTRHQINTEENSLPIEVCFRISTVSEEIKAQNITLRVKLDPKVKRLTFKHSNSSEMTLYRKATKAHTCLQYDVNIKKRTADLYKPIKLVLHYALTDSVQNLKEFCKDCAVVDPADDKVVVDKITFASGCKSTICIVDLKVTSYGISPTYILGSSETISVTYEVTNSGERAYMPQIKMTSSNKMSFYKIPPSCNHQFDYLVCDLSEGKPMLTNSKQNITIVYVANEFNGRSINLIASVHCLGEELNLLDNFKSDIIALKEFTEIEVMGKPNTTDIDLQKYTNSTAEIIYEFEVQSIGQSIIQELEVFIEIPIAKQFYKSTQLVPIIDVDSIAIEGSYNGQRLLVEKTLLVKNSTEIERHPNGNDTTHNQPRNTNSVELGKSAEERKLLKRRRRNTDQLGPNNEFTNGSASINRKIVFSCIDPEISTSLTAVMKVKSFSLNTPIFITLKYQINLTEVNTILIEPWEFFEVVPHLAIVKVGDSNGSTINVKRNMEYSEIFKHHLYTEKRIPFWLISLAIFGGLVVLTAMIYGLQKVGFFERTTKEEMERILQERQDAEKLREQTENKPQDKA